MADDNGHDHEPDGTGHDPVEDAKPGPEPDGEHERAGAEWLVNRYWERIWLDRDLDALEDLVADPVVRHMAEGTETLTRRELRRRLAAAFEAVRGCEVSIHDQIAEGPTVWTRLTLRGVSLATAKPMSVAWMAQYRVEDGRIAEIWSLHQPGADWSA